MEKIIGIYKITNTVTGDFYIGSSKDIKQRFACHKCQSTWNEQPNSQLYKDMQKYGIDKFDFQILANVEQEQLKEAEQKFIEMLNPTYNSNNAKGLDIEKRKKYRREYHKNYQKAHKDELKEYYKSYNDKYKEYRKEYYKAHKNKYKEYYKEYYKANKMN